ncbi:MAG: helix-turn-helix domain-containing protein [Pseudonocardia sp.]
MHQNFGLLLQAYRGAFDPPLTQAVVGQWLDLSQAQISRIESGCTPVNDLTKLTQWAAALSIPVEMLWFELPGDACDTSPSRDCISMVGGRQPVEDEDVRRGDSMSASSLSPASPPASTQLPPQSARFRSAQCVSADDVIILRETTSVFRRLDNRFGGGHGGNVVGTYLTTEVSPFLLDGNFARGVRKDFFRAAVELHHLAGWMAYDVGDNVSGRFHIRRALELATEVGDDALCAEMLAALSHQAAFHRRADEAIDMALAARRAAVRSGMPVLHAETAVLEAHGLALQGNARGCIAALQRAEKAFTVTDGDSPTWLNYFDEAYLAAKFAHAFRDLGRTGDAERFARRSLQMSEGYDRGRLFNNALLASILIDQGKVDEGAEYVQIAVGMAGRVRSSRVRGYLHDVGTRLLSQPSHVRTPDVRQSLAAIGIRVR